MTGSITFVIITGLSGAGKSYAIKCFEDMGFFCVDNLPTTLIPTFADLSRAPTAPAASPSASTCARASTSRTCWTPSASCAARGHTVEVLFLEASEESLVRRYHETRRRHPLAPDGNVVDGIQAERKASRPPARGGRPHRRHLGPHRAPAQGPADRDVRRPRPTHRADGLPGVLRLQARRALRRRPRLRRPLPAQPALRGGICARSTGGTPACGSSSSSTRRAASCCAAWRTSSASSCPLYQREGKAYLTVAVGCTGGRHRSVALVEALKRFLDRLGLAASVAPPGPGSRVAVERCPAGLLLRRPQPPAGRELRRGPAGDDRAGLPALLRAAASPPRGTR